MLKFPIFKIGDIAYLLRRDGGILCLLLLGLKPLPKLDVLLSVRIFYKYSSKSGQNWVVLTTLCEGCCATLVFIIISSYHFPVAILSIRTFIADGLYYRTYLLYFLFICFLPLDAYKICQ